MMPHRCIAPLESAVGECKAVCLSLWQELQGRRPAAYCPGLARWLGRSCLPYCRFREMASTCSPVGLHPLASQSKASELSHSSRPWGSPTLALWHSIQPSEIVRSAPYSEPESEVLVFSCSASPLLYKAEMSK